MVTLAPSDVAQARQRELQTGPWLSGRLQPREQATITAQVGGAVQFVGAELGDHVRRHQLLARIDPGGLSHAVRSARARVTSGQRALELAQHEAERSAELEHAGALAAQKVDADRNAAELARAQLDEARAQLASAQHSLSETQVRAPMDGVISVQAVYKGDVVSPGSRLFSVIDPSSLRLEASVPSSALGDLQRGGAVRFAVHGQPENEFQGEIERMGPAADPTSGQISLLIAIPNRDERVLAGLFAEGRVLAERTRALAVPLAAVDWTGTTPAVTRIRDAKAERIEVKTGLVDDVQQLVAITEGLNSGDTLVVGPARDIEPGTPVRIEQASARAGEPRVAQGAQ
jgi:membrane fusion protein (multidrug efflux system)